MKKNFVLKLPFWRVEFWNFSSKVDTLSLVLLISIKKKKSINELTFSLDQHVFICVFYT